MQWKILLGGVILVMGAVRLGLVLLHFEGTSYGVGQLTGGILVCLFGAWLIHSGRQQVKS